MWSITGKGRGGIKWSSIGWTKIICESGNGRSLILGMSRVGGQNAPVLLVLRRRYCCCSPPLFFFHLFSLLPSPPPLILGRCRCCCCCDHPSPLDSTRCCESALVMLMWATAHKGDAEEKFKPFFSLVTFLLLLLLFPPPPSNET